MCSPDMPVRRGSGSISALGMVKTALTAWKANPEVDVPCSGFDLINAFNAWKKTEDAGRYSSSTPMVSPMCG